MTVATLKLHARLYRAQAIDEALDLIVQEHEGVGFTKRREGDYYLVEATPGATPDLLAEIADAALVITVEQDHR